MRGVCIREIQNSIKDSVKTLVDQKIASTGLASFFDSTRDEIRGANGSLMVFKGMQDYNADNIKSLEGFDWAWVEEAQNISHRSWRLLRPTIRKPKSEIWCSWNPRWDTDAVDEFFRGANKPIDAVCVEINWPDNPWFPDVLRKEMERDFSADPDMAEHVWNGGYEIVSEGAYYARLIADAERQGRIGKYPYKAGQKIKTSWDLGISDFTSIWFWTDDGLKATVHDYYEAGGQGFDEILSLCMPELFIPPAHDENFTGWTRDAALERLKREIPYEYAEHFLPHDVRVREQGAGGRHRHQILTALGMKNLRKGVAADPETRVGAVRNLLPITRFDDNSRVQLGLKRLRRYRKKFNDVLGYTTAIHDENSHAADAFGEYAVNGRIHTPEQTTSPAPGRAQLVVAPDIADRNVTSTDKGLNINMSVEQIIAAIKRQQTSKGKRW